MTTRPVLPDFQTLLDTAPVYIACISTDHRYLAMSRRMEEFFGRPRQDLMGRHLTEVQGPERYAEVRPHLLASEAGKSGRFERTMRNAAGELRRLDVHYSPLRDDDGAVTGTLVVITDVTEQVAAEDALRASDERFRALVQESVDILAIFDGQGALQFVSPSIERALGFGVEESLGRHMTAFVHPDDVQTTREFLEEMGRHPDATARCLVRHPRKDGGWRHFQCVGRNLMHVPGIAGFVVNSRDVTEQYRLETQLQEARKLEGLGRLAGGLAHDFNNLLTVVLGYAELLARALPAGGEEADYVREIRQAGEGAKALTQQLLAFARRQVVAPRILSLNDLVATAERLLKRLLGEDIRIECRLAPDLWAIEADPAQLHQVLMNLALNARDAMPTGGTLTIETANVVVSGDAGEASDVPAGSYAVLTASDTGHGMLPHVVPHVFEPFFTTKAPGRGTGLGLATVWGIVTQCAGHIRFETTPDHGTTFRLYFPESKGAPVAADSSSPLEAAGGSETVVVVEDEDGVRDLMVRTLGAVGYRVQAFADPVDALATVSRGRQAPTLLVTDVVMPSLSGKQLADRLAQVYPTLKVLYVSGYAEDAIVHRGVPDPDVALLPKPFTPADLLARVRSSLDAPPGGRPRG